MSSHENKNSLPSSSRREFLKTSGRVAVASTLIGAATPRVHAGHDSTVKLALIGCGGRGTGAVGNAMAATGGPLKLHAMADIFQNRLDNSYNALVGRFGERVDVAPDRKFVGFDAYRNAIDSLDPNDVVILTTHSAFRPVHFDYAVERGVNVFMEKSFAVDSPATRRLMLAGEKSVEKNMKVGVGFMWRHSAEREAVIERIHGGEIGDVNTLRIYRAHGPVHCPARPADQRQVEFQLQHASRFNWACAGFYIDWHCHNIDVGCWAKGAWPVKAQGMGGRCYKEAQNYFDHYTVEYTFEDGAKMFVFSRHMPNCWGTYADYAHGTKGSAVLMTNLAQPNTRIYNSQNMAPDTLAWQFEGREQNPYDAEWQLLLDAIRNDTPHNEVKRAGEANFAALMGRAATHSGQEVTWDQAVNSEFQHVADIDNLNFDSEAPIVEGADGLYPCPVPGLTIEH